jgi:uncharacterized protein YdaU (DUF1376 family)
MDESNKQEKKLPYMKFFPSDYLTATAMLDHREKGVYTDLLFQMWLNDGWLPNDDKKIARLLSTTPTKWKKLKENLQNFFDFHPDFFTQKRISRDLKKLGIISVIRAENGRKGGQKKAENRQMTLANATDLLEVNYSKSDSKPPDKDLANDVAKSYYPSEARYQILSSSNIPNGISSEGGDAHTLDPSPPIFKKDFSKMIPDHLGIRYEKAIKAGEKLSDEQRAQYEVWKELSEKAANANPAVQQKLKEIKAKNQQKNKINKETYSLWLTRLIHGDELKKEMITQMQDYERENGLPSRLDENGQLVSQQATAI